MLVLSRKLDESVVVGGDSAFGRVLKITVVEIKNGQVKLGFQANDDVPIHRSEVYERIRAGATRTARAIRQELRVCRAKRLACRTERVGRETAASFASQTMMESMVRPDLARTGEDLGPTYLMHWVQKHGEDS